MVRQRSDRASFPSTRPPRPFAMPITRSGDNMAERLEPLISERRIRARTAALARRIDADYRGQQLRLVVVLKGAVVFAVDLMRHITIPATIDFIAASSY